FAAVAALALAAAAPAGAEVPTVVASIKPVHALVAAVMQGAGSPHLIVKGGASPHATALKPSDAAALESAAVVVWVGEGLEAFLAPALDSLAGKATVIELAAVPGLTLLPYREGGPWAEHDEDEEEHAHEEAEEHDHGHAHDHEGADMHLWLDPENAKAIVAAIADALIAADPDNSGVYAANKRAMDTRLDQLSQEIARDLAPVKDVPFVVFHDAFQYFDHRFGLNTVGSITVNPETQPGAQRIREIHDKIATLDARCVFAEPQFEPRLVQVVVEGTAAKTGTLDPLGADIPDGPELYFELLRRNAAALKACLGEAS
ncbi:MAG TPA: zinc ABC transporter substrate-binding protein ZnuA, partial [Kiloniellaceae bacterium]|nr:zinc ABC transporter substrate-binding protein ZnuA [Kiloniellaceae bacterium]